MTANTLLVITVFSVFMGVTVGFISRYADPSADAVMLFSFPGEVLMRMLKMITLPLIASSMISGQ